MNAPAPAAIPADTLRKQRLAADPGRSAWVSANAGSGKTFVLTQRVVRLLLEGADPARILCLTFTKAAAANMAIRVFRLLGQWVTLDDRALAEAIRATGARSPDAEGLAAARRLFARTLETPGGLKILTIHAFCERLLHAFPFEANVAAGFTVIEELRQADLLARAREAVLSRAAADPGDPTARALALLAAEVAPEQFTALLREVAGHRAPLREALAGGTAAFAASLARALGGDGRSVAAIERDMTEGGLPASEWDAVGRQLLHVAKGKSATGEALLAAASAPAAGRVDAYLAVFLTGKLEKRAPSYLAKPVRTAEPALCARLDAEADRLVALLAARRAAAACARTVALVTVAGAVLDRYDAMKRRAGLLDFDDLIERSRELVTRSDSAWILFKLDSGIDHLLVDEAQDTSPEQWDILLAITRDFFTGEGAREGGRTVFAVGDEKQSIYSFQGARPERVETVRRDLLARARDARRPFEEVGLLLSFRSVHAVLDVVDRVFAHGDNARGLTAAGGEPPPHQALKARLPGVVEIWPRIGATAPPDPADWRLPVDVAEAGDPAVTLARRIADRIAAMIAPGSPDTVDAGNDGGRRPVRPGDVLVLVRARNAIFEAVIRALKTRGVPVAGADRLVLTDHIATADLIAAGKAALLPEDDLTLACVLKSPLIGFDDDDLIRLAPSRDGSLEEALRASPLPRDRAAANRLAVWRDRAATLTPFAFYTRLLGADGGRRALLGRLGLEAADVVDEFVALTLAHERDGAPSLLAFLSRLESATLTIKRDLDVAHDAVRVMTVHAAKGLEAKVVFLPDTCGAPGGRHDARLFRLEAGAGTPALLAWSPREGADTPATAARREAERAAALDEHRRLLYVALTRAEERLYVAGAHGRSEPSPDCWYDMIVAADLGTLQTVPAPWGGEDTVQRRADPVAEAAGAGAAEATPAPGPAAMPDWLDRQAPVEMQSPAPLRPSNALGAADRPDRTEDAAPTARKAAALAGRLAHRLLQYLPDVEPARRAEAAAGFLRRQGGALGAEARAALVAEVMGVLASPELEALFGPGSRAEVAVSASVAVTPGRTVPVIGQIDRVAATPGAVLIADFKSGPPRPLAETPPSYLAQLALYAAAVAPLYPGRPVRAFLVWTAGPLVVEADPATLAAALAGVAEAGGA